MTLENKWIGILSNLNVSRGGSKGVAPNKPLLMLSIIDLVEAGKVGLNGLIVKDAELFLRFRSYSPICVKRRGNKIDLDLPFRHLVSDGIYKPVGTDETKVILNPELLSLLTNSAFRNKARKVLVSTYFPANEQIGLCAALGVSPPSSTEVSEIREDAEEYRTQLKRGRSARFAVSVISGYHFTCALTGYRISTSNGFMLLEAAHIQAHSQKGPDVPENGLALTPTAHELFDAGLWTISDDLKVIVLKERFAETVSSGGEHFNLNARHGKSLCFDQRSELRPGREYLRWHRKSSADKLAR